VTVHVHGAGGVDETTATDKTGHKTVKKKTLRLKR
jgi:hypothetical protein